MSKDIRSYFLTKGPKKDVSSRKHELVDSQKKKLNKRVNVIDSDSDDEIPSTKRCKQSSDHQHNNKIKPNKTPKKTKLVSVEIKDIFDNHKVRRSMSKGSFEQKINLQDKETNKEAFNVEEICYDRELEATLDQVNEIEAFHTKKTKGNVISEMRPTIIKTEATVSDKDFKILSEDEEIILEKTRLTDLVEPLGIKNEKLSVCKGEVETNSKNITLDKPILKLNSDNGESLSLDSVARKQRNALHYMRYLQREGPKHLGNKEVPKGKPGCFSGLVFVVTGVLDSLDRDEAIHIIRQYGGKVTLNVGRKTNYLIVGNEPGPAKIEKALSLGTIQLDEDGLLNLIITRSNSPGSILLKDKSNKNKKEEDQEKYTVKESPLNYKGNGKKFKHLEKRDGDNSEKVTQPKGSNGLNEEINKMENYETDASSKSKNPGTKHSDKYKNSESHTSEEEKNNSGASTEHLTFGFHKFERLKLLQKSVKSDSQIRTKENIGNVESSLWVDKYQPTNTKQVIGQQGDRSVLRKLTTWLNNWYKNNLSNKKHSRPSPWAKNDDGAFFKAALLSGPPGVGKTTMAHLVSKELGFDIVEFNASDTRSKKLLHLQVAELLSSKSLFGYFHNSDNNAHPSVRHVLLMDEVDGIAGNEDRGGIQEMIQLIKTSHIPIICMCNDRNHPKIRSLLNYCFDLRVNKPRVEQIRGAMMSICFKEQLKISYEAMNDIINGTNQDIRQILHHLSMWSVKCKEHTSEEAKNDTHKVKDTKLGPWDVLKRVFSAEDHKKMTIHEKSDLFFHDYNISPLFVQDNYLSVVPTAAKGNMIKVLELVAQASESISMGDIVDKSIRSNNAWNLLPIQAMFSSVIPGDVMEGYFKSQINFPAWLGKNSRCNKCDRLLQELHVHMRLDTSGSKQAINLDYLTHIRDSILRPLITDGASGVPAALVALHEYHLMREDLEALLELTLWPDQKDPWSQVESKVKAALTRAYNKEGIRTPYSVVTVIKKRTATSSQDFDMDGDSDRDELNDDVFTDAMIKATKRSAACSSAPKRGRGKGKAK